MIALVTLSIAGLFSMVSGIFNINVKAVLAVLALLLAGSAGFLLLNGDLNLDWNEAIQSMVHFDGFAIFFTVLIVALSTTVLLLSEHYMSVTEKYQGEFLSLVVFSTVGMICMVSFADLSMLFIGIEIMSVPLYILAGSNKRNLLSNESSLKYFLMGAFTTGILLMGVTLVYGATNSFNAQIIGSAIAAGNASPLLYLGVFFLIFAFCFKISAFPFHFWTPDVYQGAPTWITSFMSTVVKVAGLAGFFRLFSDFFGATSIPQNIQLSLAIIAAITITIGTISAVFQTNIKRILAYSSISHAGYMLISIVFVNKLYASTLLYYTLAYSVSSLALFGVLMTIESKRGSIQNMDTFNGFAKKNSFLAFVAALALISMAGIPPTSGFFAKFSVLKLTVEGNYLWLAIVGVVNAIIGIFYYFKLIISMYFKQPEENDTFIYSNSVVYNFILVLLVVVIIGAGIFSDLIINSF
jgi:NADH-quinone oxidoreductase subunit N